MPMTTGANGFQKTGSESGRDRFFPWRMVRAVRGGFRPAPGPEEGTAGRGPARDMLMKLAD